MFSPYLDSRHALCRELVRRLNSRYAYASVLGKHVTGKRINVSTTSTTVADTGEKQCGFVVKVNDGSHYSEYSFTDITDEMINNAGGSGSAVGTGGMKTKLEAARYAKKHGIKTVIMSGENPTDIYKLLDGEKIGTLFC